MKKKLALILSFLFLGTTLCGCKNNGGGAGGGAGGLIELESPLDSEVNKPILLIGADRVELTAGETFTINYLLKYSEETIYFSSSNASIATVDANGKITAQGVGEAVITIQAGECYETCLVQVNAEPAYRIICNDGDILLLEGGEFVLTALLKKGNSEIEAALTYESMNEAVATVSNGVIKGVGVGNTQIKISCIYENEYYEKAIPVIVNNSAYIDVDDQLTIEYKTSTTIQYQICSLDDEIIPDAVAEIKSNNTSIISVVGNTITANDCGKATLSITYGSLSVEISVEVVLGVGETEFNLFEHNASLNDIETKHFNFKLECVSPTIVNEVMGETGNFLCVSSLYANPTSASRPSCQYLGLYMPARLSKEKVEELKAEGYTKLKVEYCIQSSGEDGVYAQVLKKAAQGEQSAWIQAKNFNKWYVFTVSIDDILANYDALANKTQMFFGFAVENEVDEYRYYMKPLRFSK